jgi:sugar phosphate isomerase/epimerase
MTSTTSERPSTLSRRDALRWAGIGALALGGGGLARLLAADAPPAPTTGRATIAFGVCGSKDKGEMLKAAGGDYIEESTQGLLIPQKSDAEFEPRIAAIAAAVLPVKACNSFLPNSLPSVGEKAAHDEIVAYADVAFRRAKQVGIENITFGSGGSRRIPDGFAPERAKNQFTDLLIRLGPLAAKHGVTVSVEPLNKGECNFLNNVREVADVVGAAAHPAVGITADLYHMVLGGDVAEDLEKSIRLLKHFHIAEKAKRAMPGVAGDDFRPWFKVGGGGDQAAYTNSFAYLRKQLAEAGG